MRLSTFLFKKLTGKLKKTTLKRPSQKVPSFGDAQCDGMWGELKQNIEIKKHIEARGIESGGGWDLIINNYTKCDVPEHIDWDMQFYEDVDCGDVYVISQVKEEIYFLFWVVATLYSFDTWIRLPKTFFEGDLKQSIRKIFDFTNHGAADGYGIKMNSRIWINSKDKDYHYINLGNMCHIYGIGRNDSDQIIVNF